MTDVYIPEMAYVAWHDATRELPEADVNVLAVTHSGKYIITSMYAWHSEKIWKSDYGAYIAHWCYLPKAPRKEAHNDRR
jgi:hypothetical protein